MIFGEAELPLMVSNSIITDIPDGRLPSAQRI
jgi:hypothetical protein